MTETTSAGSDPQTMQAELSNWGRWGSDDERGTLNYIDEATIANAAKLVRSGRCYRLAIPVTAEHASPMREGALHVSSIRRDLTASRRQVAVDVIAMHTHDFTHVDSLAHVGYEGHLYNGLPLDTVEYGGAARMSVDGLGVVAARAIVADIPTTRGTDALRIGDVVTPNDLDAALARVEVEPRRGDVLLLRTGWITSYLADRSIALEGWPGLGVAAVDWLNKHEIAAVGADNVAVEVKPFEDDGRSFIVHERFIRDLGGCLIEFLDLEELVRDKVSEGFFMMAPLRLVGGLGSPVTPVLLT